VTASPGLKETAEEFLTAFTINIPEGTPGLAVADAEAREAERAGELAGANPTSSRRSYRTARPPPQRSAAQGARPLLGICRAVSSDQEPTTKPRKKASRTAKTA
jgi:hypothetical protein